jgi:hypothetical protein
MNNVEYSHPMYAHIYATDEEKVEILNSNPYRYYIAPNVWIFRGIRRIEILDEIKQNALKENKTELLNRIEEVRANLMKLEAENE